MARASTLALRRLHRPRKIEHKGVTFYLDRSEEGSIIDVTPSGLRERNPITLERWLPDVQAWEVIETYCDYDRALPRAKQAKDDSVQAVKDGRPGGSAFNALAAPAQPKSGWVFRVRDRRSGDVIMADIL